MDELEKLRFDLESLGTSPDEIARTLVESGVRGLRLDSCNCPVARWLVGMGYSRPSCCPSQVVLLDEHCKRKVAMPAAVGRFMVCFDRGDYPLLEMKAA